MYKLKGAYDHRYNRGNKYWSEIALLESSERLLIFDEISGVWKLLGGSYKFTDDRDSIIWYEQ